MKLKKLSLFGAVAGALLLTAALAPKANALTTELLVYYNFNSEADGQQPPYLSVAPGLETGIVLDNTTGGTAFPSGNLTIDSTAGTVLSPFGGTVYQETTDGGALDARGNTTGGGLPNPAQPYCFVIGPFSANTINTSIGFALLSTGTGQFTTLTLSYSTDGTTFTDFHTFTSLHQYTTYTALSANLPAGAQLQSTLYIQFCFTGASNNNTNNNTFIDNIQITGDIPEPSTYIGGLLGIAGLCWYQRRWLVRCLRLRCT